MFNQSSLHLFFLIYKVNTNFDLDKHFLLYNFDIFCLQRSSMTLLWSQINNYPHFWGLTPNFSVLSTFLLFFYFTPIFRYLYPNLYQFRVFLSYPQLSSVWNLSQLFSFQFRPYPHFWGLNPKFSVLGTFLLFFLFYPYFSLFLPKFIPISGFFVLSPTF